jgi:hypothetical protein
MLFAGAALNPSARALRGEAFHPRERCGEPQNHVEILETYMLHSLCSKMRPRVTRPLHRWFTRGKTLAFARREVKDLGHLGHHLIGVLNFDHRSPESLHRAGKGGKTLSVLGP